MEAKRVDISTQFHFVPIDCLKTVQKITHHHEQSNAHTIQITAIHNVHFCRWTTLIHLQIYFLMLK